MPAAHQDQQAPLRGSGRAGHRPEPTPGPPLPGDARGRLEAHTDSLRHKQDAVKVARARRVLNSLKKKAPAGRLSLYFLDECGVSLTLPPAYSSSLPGRCKSVPYEAPQGCRVNAMATYRPYWGSPRLEGFTAERTWDSYDLPGFLMALPRAGVPRVVVLDNTSVHTSRVIRGARAGSAAGIYLYFLPPYAPELNEIEPVFWQVK